MCRCEFTSPTIFYRRTEKKQKGKRDISAVRSGEVAAVAVR